jgi:hypothetical protein
MKLAQMCQKPNKARKRWAGRVSAVGDVRGSYRVLVGNLRERDRVEDTGVKERIILQNIFNIHGSVHRSNILI